MRQDGTATTRTFLHIPSSIEAEEAEEIGVEHLLRDIKDISIGTLSNSIAGQLSSLKGLGLHLGEMRDYLSHVSSGKLPLNHEILTHLQDIFNLLPNLSTAPMVKAFAVQTNDEMMAMYLSSLVRAVIALHGLIDNKLILREAEKKEDSDVVAAGADTKAKPPVVAT